MPEHPSHPVNVRVADPQPCRPTHGARPDVWGRSPAQGLPSLRAWFAADAGGGARADGNGLELLLLYRGLRWVVVTCLVRELGYSEAEAAEVVKRCSRFSSDVAWFHHLGPDGTVNAPPVL